MSVKLCVGCQEVKPLETGYYRAGNVSWQKNCKICHNKKRSVKIYVRRPKGFAKLPEETKANIIYDIHVKVNYRDISTKYNIKYPTLLSWKRKGLISTYIEPPVPTPLVD
jgi:hypothetical protein